MFPDGEKRRVKDLRSWLYLRLNGLLKPANRNILYNLTASQRRIIHLFLTENPDIKTESQGEDKDRFLISFLKIVIYS
jgi:hypothetical protein